jgi:hypothetical protein
MRLVLVLLLTLSAGAYALPADEPVTTPPPKKSAPNKPSKAATPEGLVDSSPVPPPPPPEPEAKAWLPISLNLHYGLTVDTQDPDVRNTWHHDMGYSYLFSLGAYWNFPKMFGQDLWLFVGPEFSYLRDEEEISSDTSNSYVYSTIMQFFGTIGATWQPDFFARRAGLTAYLGVPVWGQKSTTFNSYGYSRDLGTRAVDDFGYGGSFHYVITPHWKPYIGYEYRVGSLVNFGVNYVF